MSAAIHTGLPVTRPLFPGHSLRSPKRLRSCLSPHRLSPPSSPFDDHVLNAIPSGSRPPSSPLTSRSTSFSSDSESSEGWRRVKSVRWEGEDEDEASAVTSYHPTWSATEYDRTPLDPPSAAERNCVLPERNSRCLRTSLECFDTILDCLEAGDAEDDDGFMMDRSRCLSPAFEEDEDVDEEADEHTEGDHRGDAEWEECMERRRMMFAHMCRSAGDSDGDERERYPEFDGYRSISSTLVDLLRSVGAGQHEMVNFSESEDLDGLEWQALDEREEQRHTDERGARAETPSLVSCSGSEMGSSAGPASPSLTLVGEVHDDVMLMPVLGGPSEEVMMKSRGDAHVELDI